MEATKWALKNIALPVLIASLLISNQVLSEWVNQNTNLCKNGGMVCSTILGVVFIISPILAFVLIVDGIKLMLIPKLTSRKLSITPENMPSISRMSPLRVIIENNNSQNVICKAILIDAFSPDESVRKYVGSKLSWQGGSTNINGDKEIDAKGGKETLLLANIDEKELVVLETEDKTKYRGKKLGQYRIIYEIRGKIGNINFSPIKIDHTFEVLVKPKTSRKFIKSIKFEKN